MWNHLFKDTMAVRTVRGGFDLIPRRMIVLDDPINRMEKLRDFVLYYVPQDVFIYSEVFVDDNVSQPCDFAPFHFRVTISEIIGQMLDCLTDDGQVVEHCIRGLFIGAEGLEGKSTSVPQNFGAAPPDVFQVNSQVT